LTVPYYLFRLPTPHEATPRDFYRRQRVEHASRISRESKTGRTEWPYWRSLRLMSRPTRNPEEQTDPQQRLPKAQQQRLPPRPGLVERMRVDGHAVLLEERLEPGVGELRLDCLEEPGLRCVCLVRRIRRRILEGALNHVAAAGDLADVVCDDLRLEEGVWNVDALLRPFWQEHLDQEVVDDVYDEQADPPRPWPHQWVVAQASSTPGPFA